MLYIVFMIRFIDVYRDQHISCKPKLQFLLFFCATDKQIDVTKTMNQNYDHQLWYPDTEPMTDSRLHGGDNEESGKEANDDMFDPLSHSVAALKAARSLFGSVMTPSVEYQNRLETFKKEVMPLKYYTCPSTEGKNWGLYEQPHPECDNKIGVQVSTNKGYCYPEKWAGNKCIQDPTKGLVKLNEDENEEFRDAVRYLKNIASQNPENTVLDNELSMLRKLKKTSYKENMNAKFTSQLVPLLVEVYNCKTDRAQERAKVIFNQAEEAYKKIMNEKEEVNKNAIKEIKTRTRDYKHKLYVPKHIYDIVMDTNISKHLKSKFSKWWRDFFSYLYSAEKEKEKNVLLAFKELSVVKE